MAEATQAPASQPGLAVAEVFQRRRRDLKLSSRALSARAGLSEAYVKRLENGMTPGLVAFASLAVELRLTMSEIYFLVLSVARTARESDRG